MFAIDFFQRHSLKLVARWVVGRAVAALNGDEGFMFGVMGNSQATQFHLLAHVRTGKWTRSQRVLAQQVFLELAQPCIKQCREGIINLVYPDETPPQKCLVTVLGDCGSGQTRLVLGIIVPSHDPQTAIEELRTLGSWQWLWNKHNRKDVT